MRNHFLSLKLSNYGENSYVLWSKEKQVKGAVIFIHGFRGDTYFTFGEFDNYATEDENFKNYDLYFYGYNSTQESMYTSAASFSEFLRDINLINHYILEKSLGTKLREKHIIYENVVIVAHSLGAAVSRIALIYAKEKSLKWLDKVKLILFAPAHMGARGTFSAIIGTMPTLLGLVTSVCRFKTVTMDELINPATGPLAYLHKETEKYINQGILTFTVAKEVIAAEFDEVVNPEKFINDPPPKPVRESDHITVCKPKSRFDQRIKFIKDHL